MATNALTQAIPEICTHDFSKKPHSLKSELYHSSLWLMRAQYLAFGFALLLTAITVMLEKVQRPPQLSKPESQGGDRNV